MKICRFIFLCLVVLATAACNERKEAMGPEEVAVAFGKAVAAGDFDAARELCDSAGLFGYLRNCQMAMSIVQKEDSSAFAIAASILAGAEFEVVGTERNGEERIVTYQIKAEKNTKVKKAVLRKEEGEWRVVSVADAI